MSSLLTAAGAGFFKDSAFVTGSRSFPAPSCRCKTKPAARSSVPAPRGGCGSAARGREARPASGAAQGPRARLAALGAGAAPRSAEHRALRPPAGQAGPGWPELLQLLGLPAPGKGWRGSQRVQGLRSSGEGRDSCSWAGEDERTSAGLCSFLAQEFGRPRPSRKI